DREDVQAVARAGEDLVLAAVEELAQQRARRGGHLLRAGLHRVALLGIAARERGEHRLGVVAARCGEAPRADRGAYQVARARLRGQPCTEDRAVEPEDAERLRA